MLAAVGAARSQKTHTGGYWALRQWGLRGGPSRIGWFLGPELDRAFVLVEKFCDGEGENPPICPPGLFVSRPHSSREPDPTIEMIDGFVWKAKHTARQGKNLTGRNVHVVWWTEAATTSSPMDFVRVRGRIVQSRGQCYLDAVPESRSWVKTSIIDAYTAETQEAADAEAKGETYDKTYRVVQLSSRGNPWVDEAEAVAFMRDLERVDHRIAAREAGGEWIDDKEILIPEFDGALHTFDPGESDALDYLRLEDVTEQACLRWFVREHSWLLGADVNLDPHTIIAGRLAVREGMAPDVPENWILVIDDDEQAFGVDSFEAACQFRDLRGGRYRGAGMVIDATSALKNHNAGGSANAKGRIIPFEAFQRAGFEVRGPRRMKHDGSRYSDPPRIDSSVVLRRLFREKRLYINRRTCQRLIYALRNQYAEADGLTPEKVSNTVQDRRVAAFIDALRYLAWPFFSLPEVAERGKPTPAKVYG